MSIKDLPLLDKPREKAERFGVQSLTDSELLTLIIGSGTKGYSAIDIANQIIREKKHLSCLINTPIQQFLTYKGINLATALKLCAVFEIALRSEKEKHFNDDFSDVVDSNYIYQKYAFQLNGLSNEVMILVVLNRYKKIVFETTLYQGSEDNVSYSNREIIKLIILQNGYYFYIIHNHPNGNSRPSQRDRVFTEELIHDTSKIKIKMLDHIIVSKNGFYSFFGNCFKKGNG